MDREQSIAYAKKFLEDILSFFGLNTDVHASADEDVIELEVPSTHLNAFLIGQRGDTLRHIQHIISTVLRNGEAELVRVNVDIADYKRHRNDRLREQADAWAQKVRSSGKDMHLKPMNAAERRVVHQAISEYSDLETHSEGEGRDRHTIIAKKAESEDESEK